MVIKRKSRKGTKLHESNNLSLSICAWIRNQLSGTSLSHEFYSVKLVSASHQRGMNEPFVMIMTLKEGELCYLIHRVYSSLDRPIIPIIANGCSKLTSKKTSHCVEKVKVSLYKRHYHSTDLFSPASLSKDVPLP